jgi:hypothetical protein
MVSHCGFRRNDGKNLQDGGRLLIGVNIRQEVGMLEWHFEKRVAPTLYVGVP